MSPQEQQSNISDRISIKGRIIGGTKSPTSSFGVEGVRVDAEVLRGKDRKLTTRVPIFIEGGDYTFLEESALRRQPQEIRVVGNFRKNESPKSPKRGRPIFWTRKEDVSIRSIAKSSSLNRTKK